MNREVIIAEEDRLRRLVANGQRDELVNNTSFVKDVFALGPQAVAGVEETDEERRVPHVLDSAWRRGTEPMIETNKAKFEACFGDFTGHLLDGLDWSNVVAAGSSVLAAATTAPQREQLYATADIDLFFYGLTSDDAANAKLREVHKERGGAHGCADGARGVDCGHVPHAHGAGCAAPVQLSCRGAAGL